MEGPLPQWSTLVAYTTLAAISAITLRLITSKFKTPPPPGPAPKLLIGNLTDFPKDNFIEVFSKWKEIYGDVVYLNLFGKATIILNSRKAVEDLFVTRATNYQTRPQMIMAQNLAGWEWSLAFREAGHEHFAGRKVLTSTLGPSNIKEWQPIIDEATAELLNRFTSPDLDVIEAITNYMGTIILKIGYGERVYKEHGEELMVINAKGIELANDILSQFWLVDVFPSLQYLPVWFPGAGFRRIAEESRKYVHRMRDWPMKLVLDDLKKGIISPSVVTRSLDDGHAHDSIRDATGIMYAGGLDTTTIAIRTFFLAMLVYPESQTRAQAEIDSFIKVEGRLPDSHDQHRLRYVNALLKELLRWNPSLPLAVSHVNLKDDVYEGIYIPKGSTLLPNVWLFMHDKETWGDPEEFRPERFLDEGGNLLPDPAQFVFGFGRRVCPGKLLAERILHLMAVQTLALFTIESPVGMERPKKAVFDTGFMSYPQLPKIRLTLRNPAMLPAH